VTARPVQQSLIEGMERPTGRIVGSVITGTNADLMHAIAPLYLTGSVLDVTYGEGGWWRRFKPEPFTAHDLYKLDGVDFRALPEDDASVDTVCFDPPYTISGGVETSTAGEFLDRFGIGNLGGSAFYSLIFGGFLECMRVGRTYVLVKCMEFAQGEQFHDIPTELTNLATTHGRVLHDRIVHHTGSGPGGHNIFNVKRARRHHSYLLVFAKAAA
jgi:hypothetical protein